MSKWIVDCPLRITLLPAFICFHLVSASNDTTIIDGWVDDPDGRGTFTIISSCVLTLTLCVYTAIHLNVRRYKTTELQAWVETLRWVFFGVLAPELVVFVAWRQYVSALALNRIVMNVQKTKRQSEGLEMKPGILDAMSPKEYHVSNPWTRTHSFYANMGGFVVDLEENCLNKDDQFATKHYRLTLTPRGVALLARCGYLPQISKEDIVDKSKADNLSKMLSILQALWMFAQIVGRLIVKLPVTLLEVNTLAHIICALIIYILWWDKPKLINEPTKLRGDWVAPIAAYMYMSSQISGWRSMKPGVLKKSWIDPELSILAFDPPETEAARMKSSMPVLDNKSTKKPLQAINTRSVTTSSVPRLSPSTDRGSFTPRPLLTHVAKDIPLDFVASTINLRLEVSQDLQSTRWALAAEAMSLHPAIASRVILREIVDGKDRHKWLEPITEELVDDTIGNWATENLLRDMSGFVMGMVVWSASMAYGGVHATAWNGYFPSRAEKLLWRISSVYIAGSGLTWILISMLARSSTRFKAYWKRVASLRAHWTSLISLGTLATICGLLYLAARIYLVIEAFISLRKLQAQAFDTLQWTQLIPHL